MSLQENKSQIVFKKERAKMELSLQLLQLMNGFKSKEEPTIKLNQKDKIHVLSMLLEKKLSSL